MVGVLVNGGVDQAVVVCKVAIMDNDLSSIRIVEAVCLFALLSRKDDSKLLDLSVETKQKLFYLILVHKCGLYRGATIGVNDFWRTAADGKTNS